MAIEDAHALGNCFKNLSDNYLSNNDLSDNNYDDIGNEFYNLRSDRCKQVLETSRNNMSLYHESNFIKRGVRDIGLTLLSHTQPEFLNKKLDWLYSYQL